MAFTRPGTPSHVGIAGVTATQHHTATVASDLNLADMAARAHADLSDAPTDAHHTQAHTVLSHSDGADSCKIASGTYTGDGALSQAITGIGFTVLVVWIMISTGVLGAKTVGEFLMSTNTLVDNDAAGIAFSPKNNDLIKDKIIALGTDGFTVDDDGSDSGPNQNSQVYDFYALGVEV